MTKRLYRSRTDAMVGGVCAGLAEHFGVDVTVVRLLWALAILIGGSGILAYIVAWIVIPPAPYDRARGEDIAAGGQESCDETGVSEGAGSVARGGVERHHTSGMVLVVIGAILLAHNMLPRYDVDRFWPVVLIVAGFALFFRGSRGERSSRG